MLFMYMYCVCLFNAALWSPAGKGLASWTLFVLFNCLFVIFPYGILGQVWYLIVSIPDLCRHSYFVTKRLRFECFIRLVSLWITLFWYKLKSHIQMYHMTSIASGYDTIP